MKRGLIIVCFLLVGAEVSAQSYKEELLKYSLSDIEGTARSIGAGNAFSSVGADLSTSSTNPAGLGLYRSAEISGSFGILVNNNNSEFFNSSLSSSRTSVNLPHFGGIFALPIKRPGSPTNFFQFGVTYQRLADFSRVREYSGLNNSNSKVDIFYNEIMSSAAPITYENFTPGTVQAWNTYLVDSGFGNYFKRVFAPVNQTGYVIERGGANEVNITASGNIDDIVYIGAAIGVPWMNYTRTNLHQESATYDDSIYGFRQYSQYEVYNSSYVGMNFKFGIIVKPVSFWRIGASVQTPSLAMNIEETSKSYMESVLSTGVQDLTFGSDTFLSAPYKFRYNQPLRATFGTSFFIKQYGFISIDYELNDHKSNSLRFDRTEKELQDFYNNQISGLYGIGHTLRIGGEFAWKVLRVRAGYNYHSSPFKSGVGVPGFNLQRHTATAGLGYRGKVLFADFAYARTMGSDYLSIYSATSDEPALKSKFNSNRIILSIGVRIGGKKSKQ
jgi:hypothetical protein